MAASPQEAQRQPKFGFSYAERLMGRKSVPTTAVLFAKVQTALKAANAGDGAGFSEAIKPGATMVLSNGPGKGKTIVSVAILQAIKQSCKGPYQYDEGENWVQLSWVCDTSSSAPLAQYLSFSDSPELTATIWFEGQMISEMSLSEPIWIPGEPRISAGAYNGPQK